MTIKELYAQEPERWIEDVLNIGDDVIDNFYGYSLSDFEGNE